MPSRSTRIVILLVIDVVFFFVELISGYAVGSLALVADSFHMLNDVLSLIVALYAIKLSQNDATDQYSYGWHRAEILGALVNAVFLLALCCSIFMEAIERFFEPSTISNPKIIMIVGGLGLLSNIVGLLLFHEHSHGHGHSHSGSQEVTPTPSILADEDAPRSPQEIERQPLLTGHGHNGHTHAHGQSQSRSRTSKSSGAQRARSPSVSSVIYVHPAQTRAQIVQVAQDISSSHARSSSLQQRARPSLDKEPPMSPIRGDVSIDMESDAQSPTAPGRPSISHSHSHSNASHHSHSHSPEARRSVLPGLETPSTVRASSPAHDHTHNHTHDHDHANGSSHGHGGHSHGGHGHSHGSMNMRALVLHVMGDALGNVGVIATGLVLLLAEGHWKTYFDPGISLVIAVIIFSSAFPLVKSTSLILLQGVPSHVSLNEVRSAMMEVEGVRSVHELHVWQLSENKVIASVHVQIARVSDYMFIASEIRRVLHEHGIHSATIQPEYSREDGELEDTAACLVPCPPGNICDDSNVCCPPTIAV